MANKFLAILNDKSLTFIINLMAYFVLVFVVVEANTIIQTIAGVMVGVLLLIFLVRGLFLWRKKEKDIIVSSGYCSPGLAPIGFLVLAAVLVAPDSSLLPILYGFIGFFTVVYIVSFFVTRRAKSSL